VVGEAGDREALVLPARVPLALGAAQALAARRQAEQLLQELHRRDRPPRERAARAPDRRRLAQQAPGRARGRSPQAGDRRLRELA
jgi:hypothetical protein